MPSKPDCAKASRLPMSPTGSSLEAQGMDHTVASGRHIVSTPLTKGEYTHR